MEFRRLIDVRRSVRAFKPDAFDIQPILAAARRAPTAGNLQAYEIYLVRDANRRHALARAALRQWFIAAAPAVLVFCAHAALNAPRYGERGRRLYAVQDATIACTFAMLAATDAGLASVWVGAFDDEEVRQIIGAPEGHRPIAILSMGHAAETPAATPRRPLDDLVHEVR